MHHRWESLLFLHWQLPPRQIQETLPEGLTVDTFEGEAFVGITPFFMRDVRPVGVPAIPWLSEFQELNVRTYVFDREGTPGIWFYSLNCNQPLAAVGARLLTGLPYFNAEMSSTVAEFIEYTCRRDDTPQTAEYRYRGLGSAREAEPGSLEFFLLDRYYLFSVRGDSLLREQVSHERYRYRNAEVPGCSAVPARLDGFTGLEDAPMHTCFVDGFDVKVYATECVQ
ncbi:MAG: YqjF family protein [Chthoniobacterales bacterium]